MHPNNANDDVFCLKALSSSSSPALAIEPQAAPAPHHRKTAHHKSMVNAAAGSSMPTDRTRFNPNRSMIRLRSNTPSVVAREDRWLHLCWWRAVRKPKEMIFRHSGLPQKVADKANRVIDTCCQCRPWEHPEDDTVPPTALALRFNQRNDMVLLFCRYKIVHHCRCKCMRRHAGRENPDKREETLLGGAEEFWLPLYGL